MSDPTHSLLAQVARSGPDVVAVAVGGCLGAVSRLGLSELIKRYVPGMFPTATLLVNVTGCVLLGCVMTVFAAQSPDGQPQASIWFSHRARLLLTTGLLGSFTTFSTFGFETFDLLRRDEPILASLNIAGHVLTGLLGIWIGYLIGRHLTG
ncbi:MAG: fluoride efflux transporter CrcB [Planctomycetaceae bacterium]